jgi:hypothetical protein
MQKIGETHQENNIYIDRNHAAKIVIFEKFVFLAGSI